MDTNNRKNTGRGQRVVRRRFVDGVAPDVPRVKYVTALTNEQPLGSSPAPSISKADRSPEPPAIKSKKTDTRPTELPKFPLPRYVAPERPLHIRKKRAGWKTWTLRAASLSLALFLMTGGFLTWKGYSKLHKVFHGTSTVAALDTKPVDPNLLKGEGDGRVNILLMGIGGPAHDGSDLTDTLMVLSIDPVNHTAAMLSIPRDLWIKQPVNYFGAYQKINAAYESGKYKYLGKVDASGDNDKAIQAGFDSVDQAVNEVLGVNINYHMLVNFQAFKQAVDAVGGVDINVASQLYDPTMAWENHNNPVLAPAGLQTMDGTKALLYARSRETSSDFARTERQRQILIGLKDKVLTAGTLSNPAKIDSLINAFGDNMYSDLSTSGATRLIQLLKQIGDNKISSIGLSDGGNSFVTTDHVGTASVVRPTAGFDNYAAIQAYVRSHLPDGYIVKEQAPIAVVANTVASSMAASTELKSYGYNVTSATAAPTLIGKTIVVDLSKGADPYTKNYLQKRYGVTAVTTLPAGVTKAQPGTKFVILVDK